MISKIQKKLKSGAHKFENDGHNWALTYDKFVPELEGRREALCAIGNGYFATRGAAPESIADGIHYPGTYLAGGYNRLEDKVENFSFEHEDLVNMPNWQYLTFRIEKSDWFNLTDVEILNYRQTLDLKCGTLSRHIEFRDKEGRETSLHDVRFVHMRHFHLAVLRTVITPKNWSGDLTIRSGIDARITNSGVKQFKKLKNKHIEVENAEFLEQSILLRVRTSQSNIKICQCASTRIITEVEEPERKIVRDGELFAYDSSIKAQQQEKVIVEKIVSMYTSRDHAISEPSIAAVNAISNVFSFEKLLDDHQEEWNHLWQLFDLEVKTKKSEAKMVAQLVLHLHSFHILQTASPHSMDLDVGIPARGWTGEAYQGHIFWDDLFVFPFLNLRMPEITRAMLKYRFRRLDEARKLARDEDAKGARFPWQSGSNGREETPKYIYFTNEKKWAKDSTQMQIHVNAAIAYNLWQYYESTGNLEFMNAYGGEILLEIARYFASIAKYNPKKKRYEILGVVGPDEWHVAYPDKKASGIDNNAYTNLMVVWVLSRALDLFQQMGNDRCCTLQEKLDLTQNEFKLWDKISRRMFLSLQENGIINQFEGHEKLEEFPWKNDDGKLDHAMVEQLLEKQGGHINQYKVSKQADVLMLFYLFSADELRELLERLGYRYSPDMIPRNIVYYTPQMAHNSTLSRITHAWVLSRLDRKHAWELLYGVNDKPVSNTHTQENFLPQSWDIFLEALSSDFFDIQGGTTPEGIHLGAMAGTLDIVQRCYTGLVIRDNILWLEPKLPESMNSLTFNLRYRKQSLRIKITQKEARISAQQALAEPVRIGFRGRTHNLTDHQELVFPINGSMSRNRRTKKTRPAKNTRTSKAKAALKKSRKAS